MKKRVPLLITFITGFIIIVSFFVPHRPFGQLETETLIWYAIIFAFTLESSDDVFLDKVSDACARFCCNVWTTSVSILTNWS